MKTVLVIDDDAAVRDTIGLMLETEGFCPTLAEDGRAGIKQAMMLKPDLMLVDLRMPGLSGIEVCKQMRAAGMRTPLIVLSAIGDEMDKVLLLEIGADDYVVKPFSVRELVLRVGAIVRARRPSPASDAKARSSCRYVVGPLELDVARHRIFVEGMEVHASALEMRLLVYLVEHRGRVRSREDLLADVWGYKPNVSTRTIDTHVKRLRDKLGNAGSLVETVRGTGYRLSAEFPVVAVKE